MLRRLIKATLEKHGYVVIKKEERGLDKDMRQDELFVEVYDKCREYTMVSTEKSFALYNAVKYLAENGIKGDLIECGVWRGGQVMLMAYTLAALGDTDRKLYLYDTYKGMVEPGEKDLRVGSGRAAWDIWKQKDKGEYNAWCYTSLEEVKQNVQATGYPPENFVFVEGVVEETIPNVLPENIALLRLDTDWYDSTKHELQHAFPCLVPGGVLIIDDYGCWQGSRQATDEYMANHNCKMLLHRSGMGRVGVKMQ